MTTPLESNNDAIQDRLANLGEQFNTNKSFGLMGYLENQGQQEPAPPEPVDPPAKEEGPPEWFEPLNSSLRAISENTSRELGNLRSELGQLRQSPQAPQEPAYVDPIEQRINSMAQDLAQTKVNAGWERARNSLNSARARYGEDFDYKDEDLQATWRQHIGNNQAAAENTNWDLYFKQQYDSRMVPKLTERINKLQSEVAKGSNGLMNNLGALPRGNRNGAPAPAAAANSDFDEDVYRSASKQMGKGQFKGFNRLLVEAQNRKLLRTAG